MKNKLKIIVVRSFLEEKENFLELTFFTGLIISSYIIFELNLILGQDLIICRNWYSKKQLFAFNVDFKKNINFNKIYLLNIIILYKCLDFLSAKTSGTIGVFILTNGFRNYKVYNLGRYK